LNWERDVDARFNEVADGEVLRRRRAWDVVLMQNRLEISHSRFQIVNITAGDFPFADGIEADTSHAGLFAVGTFGKFLIASVLGWLFGQCVRV
jgi:hypothetical protein